MKNYYEILGIEYTDDAKTIKQVYKQLAIKYHPDKNPNNQEAEELFKEINNAYQVLSDSQQKAHYDLLLYYHNLSLDQEKSHQNTAYYSEYKTSPPTYRSQVNRTKRRYSKTKEEKLAITWISFFLVGLLIISLATITIQRYLDNNAKKQKTEQWEALFGKAVNFLNQERFQYALEEVDRIILKDPINTEAKFFKQDIINRLQYEADKAYEDKSFAKALSYFLILKDYKTVLGLRFYFDLGNCYRETNQPQKAIEIFEYILRADTRNIGAYNEIGSIYRDLKNDYKKALQFLNAGCQIAIEDYQEMYGHAFAMLVPENSNPESHPDIFLSRAQTYHKLSNYQEALADCHWVIHLRPYNADAYLLQGDCYSESGKNDNACNSWKKASKFGSSRAIEMINKKCR